MASQRKFKNILKFDSPASWWGGIWREGLPTGNGLIGASVYGGVANNTVMINHAALSWQGYVGVLPDVSEKLKDVRKSVEEGKYLDAERIFPNELIKKNYRPKLGVPLPLCDFNIKTSIEKPVKDYSRQVNLDTGEITESYKDGSTRFDKTVFVSRENNYIIYQINRSGQKAIDVELSLDMHDKQYIKTPLANSKLPDGVLSKYENFFMYYSARSEDGTDFGAVAKVSYFGGTQKVKDNSIKITGANNLMVVIKTFVQSQRDKEWKAIKAELSANKSNYDKLLKGHNSIYSKIFDASDIDLNCDDRELSVDKLMEMAQDGKTPLALIEKLWAYGRYIYASATKENFTNVFNPYGLWCGDYKAENPQLPVTDFLQVYLQALDGNMPETVLPLLDYYENVIDDLKKNATRLFGCRGILVPLLHSPYTGLFGSVDANVIHFVGGSAIVSKLYYEYAQYTNDKKFLKDRALPFMRQAALFYEDFLKVDDTGYYSVCPSYLPENTPIEFVEDGELKIANNTTFDFALIKELLLNIINAAKTTQTFENEIAKWKDMLTKIPPYRINADGLISDYMAGGALNSNYKNKDLFHLHAAFPGKEISCDDEKYFKAFVDSAETRLQKGISDMTAPALAKMASFFSATDNAEQALTCISYIVRSMVMNNLIAAENDWRGMGIGRNDNWATYQLQANIGITDAIQRMFIRSTGTRLEILPFDLPEEFEKGKVEGLLSNCGVMCDIEWDTKKNTVLFTLKSSKANKIDLKFPRYTKRFVKGDVVEGYDPEKMEMFGLTLKAGKPVSFNVKWSK